MYVCLCNAYRDAEIREIARSGLRCAHEAFAALGGAPRCGRCLPTAQELIDREHDAAVSAPPDSLGTSALAREALDARTG